ncbi:hypothetical protein [Endozoicomonas ascidiicola]|uniref:hypothetical protein n=1 Tax=Endozoicomonas ascidiicola TaxID=1698521 RepID=UPI00082A8744|nr:hypothetical protein [Endozoicomonas ascidiicola]
MQYTTSLVHSMIKSSCAKGDPYAEVNNIQHKLNTLRHNLKMTRDISEKIVIKNRIHDLEYCLTMQKNKDQYSGCRVINAVNIKGAVKPRNKAKKVAVSQKRALRKKTITTNKASEAWVRKLLGL